MPVNQDKRPTYDEGGRHPLTKVKLVPLVVVIDWPLWEQLEKLVGEFINPMTLKPYGISAVSRILVRDGVTKLDKLRENELLDYIPSGPKGSTGRNPLSEDGQVKLSIALRQEDVKAINAKVKALRHTLIGTTTIVRWLIREQLRDADVARFYATIPEKHKNHMLEAGLTIKDLQSHWRRRRKK